LYLIKDSLHCDANRGLATLQTQHLKLHYFTLYADVKEPFEALASNRRLKLVFPIQTIGKIQNADFAKQENGGPDRT
jgi:hypothetical protein